MKGRSDHIGDFLFHPFWTTTMMIGREKLWRNFDHPLPPSRDALVNYGKVLDDFRLAPTRFLCSTKITPSRCYTASNKILEPNCRQFDSVPHTGHDESSRIILPLMAEIIPLYKIQGFIYIPGGCLGFLP